MADCLYGAKIMASSNINMEGTMSEVTLTVIFKPSTRIRMVLAMWLLTIANWIAPFEVSSDANKKRKITRDRHRDLIE